MENLSITINKILETQKQIKDELELIRFKNNNTIYIGEEFIDNFLSKELKSEYYKNNIKFYKQEINIEEYLNKQNLIINKIKYVLSSMEALKLIDNVEYKPKANFIKLEAIKDFDKKINQTKDILDKANQNERKLIFGLLLSLYKAKNKNDSIEFKVVKNILKEKLNFIKNKYEHI